MLNKSGVWCAILQSIPSGAFTELPLLQSAELQENRIQEVASNAFINVPHLLFLNLSHNNLLGLEYVGLESLRSLEVLDLSYNRLSRVSSDSLAAMEWLVELKVYLIFNKYKFHNLNFQILNVSDTPISL